MAIIRQNFCHFVHRVEMTWKARCQVCALVVGLLALAGCACPSPPPVDCPRADPPSPARPAVEVPAVEPTRADAVEDACRGGDVDACEEMFARYRLGQGLEASEARARAFFQRAAELRIARCARGEADDCRYLPQDAHPVALTPAERPLPGAAEDEVAVATVFVMVDAQGQVVVDGAPVKDLPRELRRACEDGARATLAVDGQVQHRRVVAILDELKQAGCTRIAFAVAAP